MHKQHTIYADDTVITSSNINGLQNLMNRVVNASEGYGLYPNVNK